MTGGRFVDRRLLSVWVDYMKAYLNYTDYEDYKKTKLGKLWLSLNSDFHYIDDETYIEYDANLIKDFWFCYTLRDKKTAVKLAFICISNQKKIWFVTRNSFFEVTGQGLVLRWWPKFYFDIIKYFGFKIDKFVRVDLEFSMELNTNYCYNRIFKEKLDIKTHTPFIKGWECETCYIWDKSKEKNTYQLLRFYNKKLDNHAKGKQWLYNYDDIENVTRFEIEIRRDKAVFLTEEKILDINYLFSIIVKTWYPYNYQFFKFLKCEDFKEVYESQSTYYLRLENQRKRHEDFVKYWKDFKDDEEKNKTIKIFITYAKKLIKNWYKIEDLSNILEKNIQILAKE